MSVMNRFAYKLDLKKTIRLVLAIHLLICYPTTSIFADFQITAKTDAISKRKSIFERGFLAEVKEAERQRRVLHLPVREAVEGARAASLGEERKMTVSVRPDLSYRVEMIPDVFNPSNAKLSNEINGRKVLFVIDKQISDQRQSEIREYIDRHNLQAKLLFLPGGEQVKDEKKGREILRKNGLHAIDNMEKGAKKIVSLVQ